jgi:hypothetical protein
MEGVAAPALVMELFAGEDVVAYALAVGTEPATVAPLAIPALETGCRCFNSLSNSVTRVNKLCTTSRNCFTSSADAGAALCACARPAGHQASNVAHIPIAQRREILQVKLFGSGVLLLPETCLRIRRLLSRLAKNNSNRVVASGF